MTSTTSSKLSPGAPPSSKRPMTAQQKADHARRERERRATAGPMTDEHRAAARRRHAEYRERRRERPARVPMTAEERRASARRASEAHRERKAAAEGRVRRKIGTDTEIKGRRDTIIEIVEEQSPVTIRGVYYQMTKRGLVPKTDTGYTMVMRDLIFLRRDGQVDYGALVDNTRSAIIPYTCNNLADALQDTVDQYRRRLWDDTDDVVLISIEKDALSGVVSPITRKYDVPLWPMRGFGSLTFLYAMSQSLAGEDRPIYIYHFGDYDPSGVCAPERIEAELRQHLPEADLYFTTVAVTPEQIAAWNLPSRETKKSDPRAAAFGDDRSVELDSIEPNRLRALVAECIHRHMSEEEYEAKMAEEERDRAELRKFVKRNRT
jgi:hypothetical protein